MIGRIVRPIDFERTLAAPTRSHSTHFAAHHLAGRPAARKKSAPGNEMEKLSTEVAQGDPQAVDDVTTAATDLTAESWLGVVVPKRHARRAVTRSLVKRQVREAMVRHRPRLGAGLWVIRLKRPFDRARFPSAASAALRRAVAEELDRLFDRASR